MKYRRSKLGVVWSVLMPLGLAIIVGGVYSILFSTPVKVIIPLIFASINPWTFMSGTADGATMAYPAAEGYIKQSTVPPQIFPLRTALTNFVNLLYSVLTFFGLYLFIQPELFRPTMLLCIPGLLIVFMFSLGMANIASIVNLYIRDFAPLQNLIFQGLFYATPIIYEAKTLAERGYAIVYRVNPFYYMLEVIRRPMLGATPNPKHYIMATAIALITFIVGVRVQMRVGRKVAYML